MLIIVKSFGFFALLLCSSILIACSNAGEMGDPTEQRASDRKVTEEQEIAKIDDPWLRINAVKEWTGDLDGMIERGFIRVLVIPSKTFYFLDGAQERGLSAETVRMLEEFLNKKLRKEKKIVHFVAIPIQRDQAIPYLVRGYGDIALGNWTITEERLKEIDFTSYRFPDVEEIVLVAPEGPDLRSVENLSGMEIHVRQSSSYFESLQKLNQHFKDQGQAGVTIRLAEEDLEDEDLVEMVNANLLPATVMDNHKWEWLWSKVFPEVKANPDVVIREGGEVSQMVRKNSPQLQELFKEFAKAYPVKSTVSNVVLNRYLKRTKWILNSNTSSERKKFLAVVDYFKKYGRQYDFDYLMLAAQGFQESRLDQSVRSPVGAIGIMQLMPNTAAGSPIFIENIHETEANIHAGTKYLRHIIDDYFNDPEIDEVNQMLLAFAAYNGGPTRVGRLRKSATDYGFDPNRWFNNVERIVGQKIGREPVQYVGNIYKYYIAYKRIREMEENEG
jgi:membrane-bound lytic murein transglycosylase MltF